MTTSYTPLLGLALPVTGELSGTWGDIVNAYITQYLEAAVAGTQTLSSDADVTLTPTNGTPLSATSSQYAILLCTGARTAVRYITAPAASKSYLVINSTSGGYNVVLRGAGPTTGTTIVPGEFALVVWNGSDFVKFTIADGAVTTAKIADASVTAAKLAAGVAVSNIGFTPVQQGGGSGQLTNKVYIGWTGAAKLGVQVDNNTSFGTTWPIDISGAAVAATNATNATYATTSGSTNSIGASALADPGYQVFPSGMKWAWGTVSLAPTGATNNGFYRVRGTATFHPSISYASILSIAVTPLGSSGLGYYGASAVVESYTATTLTLTGSNDYGSNTAMTVYYQVIGT